MTSEGCFTILEGFHSSVHSSIPSLLMIYHVPSMEYAAMNETAPNLCLARTHIQVGVDGEKHNLAKCGAQ